MPAGCNKSHTNVFFTSKTLEVVERLEAHVALVQSLARGGTKLRNHHSIAAAALRTNNVAHLAHQQAFVGRGAHRRRNAALV